MNTIFRDRRYDFEASLEFEQAQLFKIRSRRDRLFGEWAAHQMWLTGSEADAYVGEIMASGFKHNGDDDMLEKVAADLRSAGVEFGVKRLKAELAAAEMMALKETVEHGS